ncbi:MAG TPA: bifunctional phosphoglucose/phosphomannose isomerase [Melioribacteraceae bacterium]|nr:bifunctional phosphoglucose/phosphomannose isomerase [Melioribacteraceae bacterium]
MNKLIEKYDISKQSEILINSYEQIEYAKNNTYSFNNSDYYNINKIIICGMGGSAIGGEVILNLYKNEINIPIFINRGYDLPNICDINTLIIVSSYSGNTEESISSFLQAVNKRCKIISFSTGGKLEQLCEAHNLPFIKLKKGYHPRFALYLISFTLIKILEQLKIIPDQEGFITESSNMLKKLAQEYLKIDSLPIKLAENLTGFLPIIYGVYDFNNSLANRMKGQFNENSKLHAFYNLLPEMNHNEIIGWETYSEFMFRAKVIYLLDKDINPRIKNRFEILEPLLLEKSIEIIKFESEKDSFGLRLLEQIYLTDWVTYYLALNRKKDPAEIDYINHLKIELSKI